MLAQLGYLPPALAQDVTDLTNIAAGTAPDTSFIRADDYETFASSGVLNITLNGGWGGVA